MTKIVVQKLKEYIHVVPAVIADQFFYVFLIFFQSIFPGNSRFMFRLRHLSDQFHKHLENYLKGKPRGNIRHIKFILLPDYHSS